MSNSYGDLTVIRKIDKYGRQMKRFYSSRHQIAGKSANFEKIQAQLVAIY
jgi:hypothetical protein